MPADQKSIGTSNWGFPVPAAAAAAVAAAAVPPAGQTFQSEQLGQFAAPLFALIWQPLTFLSSASSFPPYSCAFCSRRWDPSATCPTSPRPVAEALAAACPCAVGSALSLVAAAAVSFPFPDVVFPAFVAAYFQPL